MNSDLLDKVLAGEMGIVVPLNSTSNAYENSRPVKSGQGIVLGFSGYNSKSSTQFIQGFDINSPPASGAVPIFMISVPATSNFSMDFGSMFPLGIAGRAFRTGLYVCNSSTGPTYTAGSADCWFDVQYI